MNCSNCGKENSADVKFCKFCGSSMDTKPATVDAKKNNTLRIVLTYVLMFFAIAQAVFIFMLLRDGSISTRIDSKDEDSDSNAVVIIGDDKHEINAFGGTLSIENIKYNFHLGKLLMEKTDVWNAVIVGTVYPYERYVNTKANIEKEITGLGYKINEAKETEINGKQRLIFDIEYGNEKPTILYTTVLDKVTLLVDFRSNDQEKNQENLAEFLSVLDKSKSFENNIKYSNSSIVERIMNK